MNCLLPSYTRSLSYVKMWAFPFSYCWKTAYLKKIFNETCREALKTLDMKNHSVLRALKNRQAKFGSKWFCSVSKNINQTRRDWDNFNMAIDQKWFVNVFSLVFLWNEMVLQLFTHIIYRIVSALSIAVQFYT